MEFITSAKLNQDMIQREYTRLNSQVLRPGILINIYTKEIEGKNFVALEIYPPQYNFPPIKPESDINKQIGDLQKKFFEDLKDTLNEMLKMDIKIPGIIFHGGGNLAIPDWFERFCESKGIKILVYLPKNEKNINWDDEFDENLNGAEEEFKRTRQIVVRMPELEGIF